MDNANDEQLKLPPVLYKYMPLERFITSFDDYMTGRLYFANRNDLNDPMESVAMEMRFVLKEIDSVESAQLKSFEAFKVCSLSPDCENFAMWSHYAENHTGVCIGFQINPNNVTPMVTQIDKTVNADVEQDKIMLAKIEYKDYIPVVKSNGKTTWQVIQNLFCRKLKSWEYENEWRLIVASDKAQMLKVGIITEILLGYKCKLHIDKILKWLTPEQQNKIYVDHITLLEVPEEGLRLVALTSNHVYDWMPLPKSEFGYESTINVFDKYDFDKTIADYTRLLIHNPKYAWAYNNRGVAYLYKNKWDKSMSDFNEAIRLKPDFAEAYCNRGAAYSEKKEFDKAIVDLDKALLLKPDYADALYNRGKAYKSKGDFIRAIKDFTAALTSNPDSANILGECGITYASIGDNDSAIADFNEAIKFAPNNAIAYSNRGKAYCDKGDYDHAIMDFNHAINLAPNYANAYNNRGWAYRQKGNYDQAIVDYTKSISLDPNHVCAYCNRGAVYCYKEDYDHAIADFEAALKIKPDFEEAKINLEKAKKARDGE